jgi:hypothetical protein
VDVPLMWRTPVDLGIRIRTLWHLRAGVAASLLLALLASLWSVQKISVSPPGLTPRSLEMATAATHVVVDTPTSALLDLRRDTYSLEGLTNRAVLLGNVMASDTVRRSIAQRAGVPADVLSVEAPLTPESPRPRVQAGQEKTASDILESTDQYRLSIQANPSVPVLDIYSQTPTAGSAEKLANAAVDELKAYISDLATEEQTPAEEQIRLVQLGRAEGAVINGSVHWQVALLAFFLTFAVACATVLFVWRVRQGWLLAARFEQQPATE